MRVRLFWKILFGFWLTFFCIVEGVWLIFSLYGSPRHQEWKNRFFRSQAETHLNSAATALGLGGEEGLKALLRSWPEADRIRLTYEPLGKSGNRAPEAIKESWTSDAGEAMRNPVYSMAVSVSGGPDVLLLYDTKGLLPSPPKRGLLGTPPEIIIVGVLGGLVFSALLAWYLIAPVWRLRMGFDQLTKGMLHVRLKHLMGRRRDEIADLARDFDLMAERMQSLVRSREQLLYDVSHELRSPLARLHMAIGLARQNPSRTAPLLDRIEQESSRMDELVGEVLTLSRVESGSSRFEEYFDIQGLMEVVVKNARFEAREDEVEIRLDMRAEGDSSEDSTVRGDAELVRRALENVLRNAIRHSPRGGEVDVSVEADEVENTCTITVSDQGPGVPENALEKIFEPFIRLDSTESSSTGLGLAIARRAITVHGGTIRAANSAPRGLSIAISLPLESPELLEREGRTPTGEA